MKTTPYARRYNMFSDVNAMPELRHICQENPIAVCIPVEIIGVNMPILPWCVDRKRG